MIIPSLNQFNKQQYETYFNHDELKFISVKATEKFRMLCDKYIEQFLLLKFIPNLKPDVINKVFSTKYCNTKQVEHSSIFICCGWNLLWYTKQTKFIYFSPKLQSMFKDFIHNPPNKSVHLSLSDGSFWCLFPSFSIPQNLKAEHPYLSTSKWIDFYRKYSKVGGNKFHSFYNDLYNNGIVEPKLLECMCNDLRFAHLLQDNPCKYLLRTYLFNYVTKGLIKFTHSGNNIHLYFGSVYDTERYISDERLTESEIKFIFKNTYKFRTLRLMFETPEAFKMCKKYITPKLLKYEYEYEYKPN